MKGPILLNAHRGDGNRGIRFPMDIQAKSKRQGEQNRGVGGVDKESGFR